MRRDFTFGVALGTVMLSSACATTPANPRATSQRAMPIAERPATASVATASGSFLPRPIEGGPRVTIRAQMANVADSRRVRAIFHSEDDAYVLVGHIDADGVLRIAFPLDPSDNGFVRGDRSYQTTEFFAGFNSQFRIRAQNGSLWNTSYSPDAYDGGLGYVFIIASWRPMRFDRFQTGNVWDSFEVANDSYMSDPRPAINELANLLAGDNPEPYTVRFARFSSTESLYTGYGTIASAYSSRYCSGYEPFGFAYSPFAQFGYRPYGAYGYAFAARGTNYFYDVGGDCYQTGFAWGYNVGYQVPRQPVYTPPSRPRAFDPTGHRPPPRPEPPPAHFFPQPRTSAPGAEDVAHQAPEYRQRGLITADTPSTGPVRRQPRIEAPTPVEHRERPVMQEMVNPPRERPRDGAPDGWARVQGPQREPPRTEPAPRMQVPERASPPAREVPRTEMPRTEMPRSEMPRSETRVEPPRSEPRTASPRTESPRMEQPRSEQPRREPPRVEAPRSEPAQKPPESRPRPPASEERPRVATPVKPPR